MLCGNLTSCWKDSSLKFSPINGSKLTAAIRAYSQDRIARKQRMPQSFSLQELVNGGYLSTNEIRALDGLDIIFYSDADETRPQSILAEARFPDGSEEVVLADGSVQQISKARIETMKASLRKNR